MTLLIIIKIYGYLSTLSSTLNSHRFYQDIPGLKIDFTIYLLHTMRGSKINAMENQIVTLEKQVYGGECLGRLSDGRTVFVPLGMPGEQVEIEITENKERYVRGRIVSTLVNSPYRIVAPCPHYGSCGGCQYQHITYAQQLTIKTEVVLDQLKRLGKLNDIPFSGIAPSPNPFHYRNQVQFHPDGAGRLCYQSMDGSGLIPIQTCLLPNEGIAELWPQMTLEPDSGLRRVSFREDSLGNPLIVFEGEDEVSPEMDIELPVSATYLNPDGEAFTLAGEDFLIYEILGKTLKVSPESFFQVNLPVATEMVKHILGHLPKEHFDHILELYAGVGLFSTFLADNAESLTAIEASPSACYDFADNLDAFDNVSLYEGPVESILPGLLSELKNVDLVVVDPPRAGLHSRALDALVKLEPKQLLYISCDPATLARDLQRLSKAGYTLADVHLFDMFPQTFHVETVVLISREEE
jgi:23S rRNA (uracil1939-C5)-methyltransferase